MMFCGLLGGPNGQGLLSQAFVIWSMAEILGDVGIVAVAGSRSKNISHTTVGRCQAFPNMMFLCLSGVSCVRYCGLYCQSVVGCPKAPIA